MITLCLLLCFCGCIRAVDSFPTYSADSALMKRVTHLTTDRACEIQTHAKDLKTLLETFDIDRVRNKDTIFAKNAIITVTVDQLKEFYDELNEMIWDLDECQLDIERCGVIETTIKMEKTQALDTLSHAIKTVKKSIDDHTRKSLSSTLDHANNNLYIISNIDFTCSKKRNGKKTKRKKNVVVYLEKAKDLVVSDLNSICFDIQRARNHLNYQGFVQKLIQDRKSDIKRLATLLKNDHPLNAANTSDTEKTTISEKYVDLTIALIHERSDIFYQTLEDFYKSSTEIIKALDNLITR